MMEVMAGMSSFISFEKKLSAEVTRVKYTRRGFTLIELLVVIVIIGILISMALPNYVKAKDKAKEAQVLANLHVIQAAIERYAVDNSGQFPMWLLGGDWSDHDTVEGGSNIFCPYPGFPRPCGDGDPLLMAGYLNAYPKNAFASQTTSGRQFHVLDCPKPAARTTGGGRRIVTNFCRGMAGYQNNYGSIPPTGTGGGGSNRKVGGIGGNLMWDVSEGGWGAYGWPDGQIFGMQEWQYDPNPVGGTGRLGRGWMGHPPFGPLPQCNPGDTRPECQNKRTLTRYLHPYLPGNFYYMPLAKDNLVWRKAIGTDIAGYILAGYGAIYNRGNDYYDVFGDYYTPDFVPPMYCEDGYAYGNANCMIEYDERGTSTSSIWYIGYCFNNGPDGEGDGVIGVVSSGTDAAIIKNKPKPGCESVV
jgi:prepilin-type N-terminal cleavage/methylation domain-containing protein